MQCNPHIVPQTVQCYTVAAAIGTLPELWQTDDLTRSTSVVMSDMFSNSVEQNVAGTFVDCTYVNNKHVCH